MTANLEQRARDEARKILAAAAYDDGCREETRDDILRDVECYDQSMRIKVSAAIKAIESALKGQPASSGWEGALLAVVDAVRDYLPPDGIDAPTFINLVIGAVDNPEINPIIRELEYVSANQL